MASRIACITFALLLPHCALAEDPSLPPLAECNGAEADPSQVAVHFDGKISELMNELVRFKQIEIAQIELAGSSTAKFGLSCVSVSLLMDMAAGAAGLQVMREEGTRFRLVKVRNLAEIDELRNQAAAARGFDRQQLIAVLERIVALSQSDGSNEQAASVEHEYHELGNLAMEDKDYIAAERWYRARLADLDRSGAAQDTDYGIAVSNVADALQYQDEISRAKPIYERALAVLERQDDLGAPPNAVLILETLSNAALAAARFDEAEALADRAWKVLGDPRRSEWHRVEAVLEFAASAEGEFGLLGPRESASAHYARALELLEARYPAESTDLATMRLQLMLDAARRGRLERATIVAEQQLAAARQRGERTTLAYVFPMYQLLSLYAEQNELQRVIDLWPHLIDARRAVLGDASPNVVSALRQQATLHRLNGQFEEADAIDLRAAAIKPIDDSEALARHDPMIVVAMVGEPALPLLCAKRLWTPTGLGFPYIPPVAPPLPLGLMFNPSVTPQPLPPDKSGQARYLEQTAECFSTSSDYAGRAMEQVLSLRISLNGAHSPESRRASERAIHFYQQDANTKAIERVRTLSGD